MTQKIALITGVTGQDGAYLSEYLLKKGYIDETGARALAEAANGLWDAISAKDVTSFGHYFRASFEAQIAMFPNMVTPQIAEAIKLYEKAGLEE